MQESFDKACLEAAVAGDRDAIARLVVFHAPQLNARVGKKLRFNPFIEFGVEDVLQEVFADILKGIGAFDAESGPPISAWLNKVADNRLVSMIRHQKQKKRGGEFTRVDRKQDGQFGNSVHMIVEAIATSDSSSPSELMQRDELVSAVREVIANLPTAQREAVQKHYIDGQSVGSTAKELAKHEGAVRGLVYRAKQKMREAMGNTSRWFQKRQ